MIGLHVQSVKAICAVEYTVVKGGKKIMTNREYAIKKINEVLEQVDDTRLADIFIEVIQFPDACEWCTDDSDICDCTYGIRKWLQLDDTSKQY